MRDYSLANEMASSFNPDQDYRPAQFQVLSNNWTTYLINETLTYDTANNLTGVADSINAYNNQTLGYDVINRLTSAASGTGGYGSLAWQYDKVGNLTSQTVNSSTTTYGYTSGSNRLASMTNGGTINVTTDSNGNITSIPPADQPGTAATFTYSANRLSSITGSPVGITSNLYDAFGERYSKQDPGSNPSTYTYGLEGNLIEENDNGSVTDYLYHQGFLVGIWLPATSTLYYVNSDQRRVPQMVTNSSETVVWSTTYQPYGTTSVPVGSVTQNVRLPGQYQDTETGFYYNGFRDYMPNLGRYLEDDPIGLAGGMNPYLYADANPERFVDRSGLFVGPLTRIDVAIETAETVDAVGGGPENPFADIAAVVAGLASLALPGDTPQPSGSGASTDDRQCYPQYVVRGGIARAQDLQTQTKWSINGYGFSAQSAPDVPVDELARGGFFPNPQISVTTTLDLMNLGLTVNTGTPGGGLYHSTVVVPFPPPPGIFDSISSTFIRQPNPFPVPRGN